MGPAVVTASKSGAVFPSRRDGMDVYWRWWDYGHFERDYLGLYMDDYSQCHHRVFLSHAWQAFLASNCVLWCLYQNLHNLLLTVEKWIDSSLIVCHSVKQVMWMFLLLRLQNLVNAFINVFRCFYLTFHCLASLISKIGFWPTAAAKSSIAFPAIRASSWLSLISILIMCTGLLNSPPRVSRSIKRWLDWVTTYIWPSYHHKPRRSTVPHMSPLCPPLFGYPAIVPEQASSVYFGQALARGHWPYNYISVSLGTNVSTWNVTDRRGSFELSSS